MPVTCFLFFFFFFWVLYGEKQEEGSGEEFHHAHSEGGAANFAGIDRDDKPFIND